MKKLKIYLDTSVISHLKADDVPERMESTRQMWVEMKNEVYEVFISSLVTAELGDCPEPKRTELFKLISLLKYDEILIDEETYRLAQEYIRNGIIPAKYEDDALHIAAASVRGCNVVVSWNFKHMVRAKTIFGVNGTNKMLGYGELEILSPDSLIEVEEDE
ncbi:PIN domain protein [Acididesulfobacillus acetoxydans]|uniref:PIN domain protein n=1 Tax=Acididesulfobacillus acetoxydans TaxID=1561005 RepID=A0A8S0XBJ9_9FIRM|nr:type II toxin-antitoxin system VapC family toxin [Acididesulfobacillus acetoxydans]CAA7601326.1 PIN domain protein [Acididesulfobacillus acetoxydans]CEJ07469.1 PilT protein domain protein [Acididesulfobacillus acetoxydans]